MKILLFLAKGFETMEASHLNNEIRQKQLAEYGVEIVNEPVFKSAMGFN